MKHDIRRRRHIRERHKWIVARAQEDGEWEESEADNAGAVGDVVVDLHFARAVPGVWLDGLDANGEEDNVESEEDD